MLYYSKSCCTVKYDIKPNKKCLFVVLCRAQGFIECEHLKNNVTLDCEKTEEKLMHR